MAVLSDIEIAERVRDEEMISPFHAESVNKVEDRRVISYGISSYGYDFRVGARFHIFHNDQPTLIDPKQWEDSKLHEVLVEEFAVIPPNSYALALSKEKFRIPRDIFGFCVGKSTLARCGMIVNVTPLEPEWEGYLVVEISNATPAHMKVYANEGIAQLVFLKADQVCHTSYADKAGKYQGQDGITGARMKGD